MALPIYNHGSKTAVLAGGYDLSRWLRNASSSQDVGEEDITTYGTAVDAQGVPATEWGPALRTDELSLEGLWDGSANALDAIISASLGVPGTPFLRSIAGASQGKRCLMGRAHTSKYAPSVPVGSYIPFQATVTPDSEGLENGVVVDGLITLAGAGATNGVAFDTGVVGGSANGGIGFLHVVSVSGALPTLDLKIQHATALAGAYSDLVTFAQKTAIGFDVVVVAAATTVNRYMRIFYTITGTTPVFQVLAAFARR